MPHDATGAGAGAAAWQAAVGPTAGDSWPQDVCGRRWGAGLELGLGARTLTLALILTHILALSWQAAVSSAGAADCPQDAWWAAGGATGAVGAPHGDIWLAAGGDGWLATVTLGFDTLTLGSLPSPQPGSIP